MLDLCDLQISINDEEIFLLNEVISRYCGTMKKILNNEKIRSCHNTKNIMRIEINDFPGGSHGFELVLRFCYNHGKIHITVSNVLILHCCALYLGMTEDLFTNNLLQHTQKFLDGINFWSSSEILQSLKSCEPYFSYADSCGLLENIICALSAKMVQNYDSNSNLLITSSFSSSLSSPQRNFPKIIKSTLPWWFQDLGSLPPKIIEKFLQCIVAYKKDNNNLIVTRFLIHYLSKVTLTRKFSCKNLREYTGLAETAAYGTILVGNKIFSCRGLFWVLRIVTKFGISRDCRIEIEKLIGGMLDQATLDDLLVSGNYKGLYYDVTFVIRLIKLFVDINGTDVHKLKKVGGLIDKYIIEISPDQNLSISKFLSVVECLPDSARDCYDGIYRAIDIYLQSHPMIAFEERSRLCRCLNYNKLSFEVCKDLAKNPRIPPRIAMQALMSQQTNIPSYDFATDESEITNPSQFTLYNEDKTQLVGRERRYESKPRDNATESERIGETMQRIEDSDVKVQRP